MVSSLAQHSERTNGPRARPVFRSPVGRSLARRQNIDATGAELMCVLVRLRRWLGERGRHGDGVETGAPSKESVRPSLPSAARPSARRTMPVLSPRGAFKISTVAGRPSAHYRLFLRLRHFDFPMPNDFVHLCVVACPAAASPSSPSRSSAFPRADHSRCESGRCVTAMTRLLYYTVWVHDLLQVCLHIATLR